jgi:tetratricopeptide (TPR) repeat protein
MTDSLIPFSDELEMEFKQMAFVLENVESACWVYVVYNQAVAREKIINRLQTEISLPFFVWDYSAEKPYPIDYLRDLTEEQQHNRAIISFFNTIDGGDKTIKSLDFNREKFAQYPHSLIFWVTENELGEMARKAGHFWAQRRGTFRFSKLIITKFENNYFYGMAEWSNNLISVNNYQEAVQQLKFNRYLMDEMYKADSYNISLETLNKVSYLLYYLGYYSKAITKSESALHKYEDLLGKDDYLTLATSNNCALLYCEKKSYTKAKNIFQNIILVSKQYVSYRPIMVKALNNLGLLYYIQGEYEKAESLYQESLAIKNGILYKYRPGIAITTYHLATLYKTLGKFTEAESLYKKSLAIFEEFPDSNQFYIGIIFNNLASLYESQGKYNIAEPFYIRSVEILEKTLGIKHPNTNLAKINYEKFLIEKAARHKLNPP